MNRTARMIAVVIALALTTVAASAIAASDGLCDGMVELSTSGSQARIVGLASARGTIVGVRWFNNDDAVVFPTVELYEGACGEEWGPGALLSTQYDVRGACNDWSELALQAPVMSSTGLYYVVFRLPEENQYIARGHGGGAAIGYATSGGAVRGFCSLDGQVWAGVRADMGVSVLPLDDESAKSLAKPKSAVGVEVGAAQLRVLQNPVRQGTAIAYRIPNGGRASLDLYDARGRAVRRLISGAAQQGDFAVYWDGCDDSGRPAPCGTYFARLHVGRESTTARLLLLH